MQIIADVTGRRVQMGRCHWPRGKTIGNIMGHSRRKRLCPKSKLLANVPANGSLQPLCQVVVHIVPPDLFL